jgi:hypothetical protein
VPETEFTEGVHVERHRDGSVRAAGQVVDGQPHGYWECFRLDGTLMHSGHSEHGRDVGERTTSDRTGTPYEITKK